MTFVKGAFVSDIEFAESSGRMTVNRLKYERGDVATWVDVTPDDIVFVTTGSQAADLSAGTMDAPPPPPLHPGRSWALWKTLAEKHKGFGNPDVFFGTPRIANSRWVTFTVTTTGKEFLDEITNLTHSGAGSGGLLTLKDSPWVISLSIFDQPEVLSQPPGTSVWWGYGLFPEKTGKFVNKPMHQCTGREILSELLQHLNFATSTEIMQSSICIPCNMPYVNNIWLPRKSGDRPPVVPEGVTNLGLLGQYVELERDIAFTFEYSTRTAWEAVYRLVEARPAAAGRLSGPVRSEGRVGGYESVSRSDDDLGGGQKTCHDDGYRPARSAMSDAALSEGPRRRPGKLRPLQRHETRRQQNRASAGAPMCGAPIPPPAWKVPTPAKPGEAGAPMCGAPIPPPAWKVPTPAKPGEAGAPMWTPVAPPSPCKPPPPAKPGETGAPMWGTPEP